MVCAAASTGRFSIVVVAVGVAASSTGAGNSAAGFEESPAGNGAGGRGNIVEESVCTEASKNLRTDGSTAVVGRGAVADTDTGVEGTSADWVSVGSGVERASVRAGLALLVATASRGAVVEDELATPAVAGPADIAPDDEEPEPLV